MGDRIRQRLATRVMAWIGQSDRSHFVRFVRLRVRDMIRSLPPRWEATRDDLAFRFLRGDGIEVGALYRPQRVAARARVRYVDHASYEELRRIYPEHSWVQPPDVVDEAERLETFDDESVDFVIANHVLEHVEDPVSALQAFLRVLRLGGIIFLTLPDARHNFDQRRRLTSVAHLLRDHLEGPETSRRDHYEEWAHIIEGLLEPRLIAQRAEQFATEGARHHFHVWQLDTFLELLLALELPIDIEAAQATDFEFAVVLRKTASARTPARPGGRREGVRPAPRQADTKACAG